MNEKRKIAIIVLLASLSVIQQNQTTALISDGSADHELAISQYYQGDIETSLQIWRKLSKDYPDDTAVKVNLIRLLREDGNYKEALRELQELVRREPADSRFRSALLQATYMAGYWPETVRLSAGGGLGADELHWRGLALAELGRNAEAEQTLAASLAKEPFNPMAHYRLGLLRQKAGELEQAAVHFKKAAAQEPNLTTVYYPLAQIYLGLRKYPTAYNYLLNAKTFRPWDREIAARLQDFLAEHPEVLQRRQIEAQQKRRVITPPKVITVAADRDKIPAIRIGLAEKIDQFYLKTGDRCRLTAQSGDSYQAGGQTILNVKRNGKSIEFRNEQGDVLFAAEGGAVMTYGNPAATTVLFDVEYGGGTFWAGREDRIYRGHFQFLSRDDGITIVNRLNMEEYLYSVLPAEMESSWPAEALAAQAVAARTYAFANLKAFESRGFDLLSTVASQVYTGIRGERQATNAAVDATRGMILRHNGEPISAFYCGNNGGYSNDSQDIWGFSLPYLKAVPDKPLAHAGPFTPAELADWLTGRPQTYSNHPKYSGRSAYRWILWVSRSEIESRLNQGDKLGRIVKVTVTGRSYNGLATKVTIKGTAGEYAVTGEAIRSRLGGLRSNMFLIEPRMGSDGKPADFIFYGGGWGHGVGMCQSGAAGMAADGLKYAEILEHYYPGTELAKLYE